MPSGRSRKASFGHCILGLLRPGDVGLQLIDSAAVPGQIDQRPERAGLVDREIRLAEQPRAISRRAIRPARAA